LNSSAGDGDHRRLLRRAGSSGEHQRRKKSENFPSLHVVNLDRAAP
jgi:hypothetical protein